MDANLTSKKSIQTLNNAQFFNPTNLQFIYKNSHLTNIPPKSLQDEDYLNLILTANVYNVAIQSPLHLASSLSDKLKQNVYLKREDMQPAHSFKLRGAYNRMRILTDEERLRGVITCSAGNHAQGVALCAKELGISATIVMPISTPPIKLNNVKKLGGKIVLFGQDFGDAKEKAKELSIERNLIEIPAFDDPYVIAGQGTIAPEMFRQHDPLKIKAIFVCVGGGGMIAGIAAYSKRIYPHIKVIGVEAFDAPGMTRSIQAGHVFDLPSVGLFADGAAVRSVGFEPFRIAKELVDGMVLVSTDEICAAIKDVFEDTRSVIETAGALGVAGLKKYIHNIEATGEDIFQIGKGDIIAICSGANMNFDRLSFVADRAGLGENLEVLISVVIPEWPGSFVLMYNTIHPRKVVEFSYRFENYEKGIVLISFKVFSGEDPDGNPVGTRDEQVEQLFKDLAKNGMTGTDLSYNEMAKAHIKFFGGGRKTVPNERLIRFKFPERPGELNTFLKEISDKSIESGWNVTLWHYKNYGGDTGDICLGIQVTDAARDYFEYYLKNFRYDSFDESSNPVCTDFLSLNSINSFSRT